MVNSLLKKTEPQNDQTRQKTEDRETKILNILCNVSILLMIILTDAFSKMFTNLSKEMIVALTTNQGNPENDTKNIEDLQKKLPHHLREELITMKKELNLQLKEKRKELGPLLTDSRFDKGIRIVEHAPLQQPLLSKDLDERSLLTCLTLLQANDPTFTTMFQQLLEWMNTLPQPEKKKE